MPILTTDDAEAIRKKLQRAKDTFRVETQEEGRHLIVKVLHGRRKIAQFGIQRSSSNKNHNYIPPQMHLTPFQGMQFAKCTLTAENYVEILRAKGEI